MSVRDGLLAILSLGPAYGLQLHAEFTIRAAHRPRLNAGQLYSTIDRAVAAGLVASGGSTADGLPLFCLSSTGATHAERWMSAPVDSPVTWEGMLDQVLITSTIEPHRMRKLAAAYRRAWSASESIRDDAAGRATRALSRAAIEWLTTVEPILSASMPLPLSTERPRRGRRPSSPPA